MGGGGSEEGGVRWREGVAEPCAWEVKSNEAYAVIPEIVLSGVAKKGALRGDVSKAMGDGGE